ncbi:hypothetical protein [Hydrogenophaga sp. 2FB]|uniref:hypothetical protein n=1 Tax=Hydrogenophaga sp. 2FB TaxID=2502187 RepID=UPI0010F5D534|nr:hypothetical protein [Hydrogenophaga sp. 2FB]
MNLKSRIALCVRILRAKPSNLLSHADRELPHIGTDEMGQLMAKNMRELVLVFGTQGHSGFSASYATGLLQTLLRYEPVAPLTGDPGEWVDHGYCQQNNRCGRVFKQADRFDGQAYDIDAVVFLEPNGTGFTGRGSQQPITFPYTPRTVYVEVDTEGNPLNGWNREGVCPEWAAA